VCVVRAASRLAENEPSGLSHAEFNMLRRNEKRLRQDGTQPNDGLMRREFETLRRVHERDSAARAACRESEAINEIAELVWSDEVGRFLVPLKTSRLKKLHLHAKRAGRLYTQAMRKAEKHPAPHGYGDGFFECMCSRCCRATRLSDEADILAEKAFAAFAAYKAWQNQL
jgi:hypothetical protein